MNSAVGLHNFAYYLIQVGLLVVTGGLLPVIFRIRLPKILLPYLQFVLIFSLLMPWFAPRQAMPVPAEAPAAFSIPAGDSAAVIVSDRPNAAGPDWTAILWQWLPLAIPLGCAVRLSQLLLGWLKLGRMRRSARRTPPLAPELAELIRRLGARADILISPRIPSAATFGVVRPAILLPEEFETMAVAAQAPVLAHELIHVRRRDWLAALGEQLILALFWYHPAIWWLTRRIELAREQVVDQCVLELAVDRRQYLKSLLHSAADPAALLSANLFFARHHFKERVALLLEEVSMSKTRLFTSLALVFLVLCLGAAVAAYAFPLTGSGVAAPSREAAVVPQTSSSSAIAVKAESQIPATSSPRLREKEIAPAPASTPKPAGREATQAQNLVSGTVFDSSRGRIPGAQISIADPLSKEVMATVSTDIKGDFSFTLPAGQNVELTFRSPGFTPAVVKDVTGGQPPLRIVLTLGAISETVTVTAAGLPAEPAGVPQQVQPIRIGGNVHPPKLLRKVDPQYPVEARRQGIEGIVLVQAYVGLSGEVLDARVIKGQPPLDDAAIEAVRQWQFTPFLLNGEPQLGMTTVTVIFKLDK